MSYPELKEALLYKEQSLQKKLTKNCSHSMSLVTLKDSPKKLWFKKSCSNLLVARRELLAQEFYRLIYPCQPKSRILQDTSVVPHQYYLLSEKVAGFRDLSSVARAQFLHGGYKGLGVVSLLAMFVQEIDFKSGNVGLDGLNRVIKIDGNWCFASIKTKFAEEDYQITSKRLDELPVPLGLYAYNWLQRSHEGRNRKNARFFDNLDVSNDKLFREEVNKTILRICCLNDSMIEQFIALYIWPLSKMAARVCSLLINRRAELQKEAFNNHRFLSFLHSKQAELELSAFWQDLIFFKEGFLVSHAQLVAELSKLRQAALCDAFGSESMGSLENVSLINDIRTRLLQLEGLKVSCRDHHLDQFISQTQRQVSRSISNFEKLSQLKVAIDDMLAQQTAPEVMAVKEKITHFSKPYGFFSHSYGFKRKAHKLDVALSNTPLAARASVISSQGPANEVQKALATGRYGPKIFLSMNDKQEIIEEKAADSYQELRRLFKP